MERSGLDSGLLKNEDVIRSFELLEAKKIAKESIEMIFENIMSGKSKTTEDALKNTSIEIVDDEELERVIDNIVEKNHEIIRNQKERAIGPLMGIVMRELRGKASGEVINNLLLKNIKEKLESI